ncbi:MAG: M48 family metallopeptidase [Planctomycetota bacterium]
MQVVVLAGLIASLAMMEYPLSSALRPVSVLTPCIVGVYVLGAAGLTAVNALAARRALRKHSGMPPAALKRYGLVAVLVHLWLIGGSCGVLVAGYGAWLLDVPGLTALPLAPKLAAAGPFLVALVGVWAAGYPFYRAFRRAAGARAWGLREYLAYNVRHHLLFILVPVSLIIAGQDALWLYVAPDASATGWAQGAFAVAAVGWAGVVFLIAPVLIVRVWRTRPLGRSPVRDALETMSERLGLRFRDVREWLSSGAVANAGVMGLTRHVRYVLLSDGLLENMDTDEIKAIFAHEAGHIRGHHIFYSALFAVSSLVLASIAGQSLGWALGAGPVSAALLTLLVIVGAFGLGFGAVSRRFERQCDVVAAWAVGRDLAKRGADRPQGETAAQADGAEPPTEDDPDRITPVGAAVFAKALQHVARLNGIPATRRNWRHGSIARRVSYVLWLGSRGGSRREIDRIVRRIKLGTWALAATAAVLAVILA